MGAAVYNIFMRGHKPTHRLHDAAPIIGLWTLLSLLLAPISYAKPDVEQLSKTTVRVVNFDEGGVGTGFIINADGYIITNDHVTEGGSKFAVMTPGSMRPMTAKLIATDKARDLSILKADGLESDGVLFTSSIPRINDDVLSLGFPANADTLDLSSVSTTPTPGNGVFTRLFEGTWNGVDQLDLIQHSAPINPGNSGGPLFDYCGRVIGVNTQGSGSRVVKDGDGNVVDVVAGTGIFFASHNAEALNFLKSRQVTYNITKKACDPSGGGSSQTLLLSLLGLTFIVGIGLFITMSRTSKTGDKNSSGGTAHDTKPGVTYSLIGEDGFLAKISSTNKKLRRSGLTIGATGKGANILLSDDTVSAQHARLSINDKDQLCLQDDGSTNGTRVNGRQIGTSAAIIHTGDRLQFGIYVLTLKAE